MSAHRLARWSALAWLGLLLGAIGFARVASAEPYIAIQQGYQCNACHVNPSGGGLRTTFGDVFVENLMAAKTLPAGAPVWTGQVVQDVVRIGGDLRTEWSRSTQPHAASMQEFSLEQARVYTDISVIPNLLGVYIDEQVSPGTQTMEAYLRYGSTSNWYVKAGHFYLPFGWRLQDQTAFVREVSGINMNTPDTGVEFGLERAHWDWQVDLTNGSAHQGGGGTGSGGGSGSGGSDYMATTQLIYTRSSWRLGIAGSHTRSSVAGDRDMGALFAGLRTGPVAWLGEADIVRQAGFTDGTHTMMPLLGEVDWLIHKGSNLKLTYEFYDPNTHVGNNQQTRWSAVYELTPIPFLQIRAGFRRGQGIPQSDAQNRTLAFVEAHGFF